MARYRGAKLRVTRRLGYLPGFTSKKSNSRNRPGQHGSKRQKEKQYRERLIEKQKLRFNYGLSEKQLINYVKEAKRVKGKTSNVLLQLLEMRLDNTIFRLGMAPTIAAARQLVGHRHIVVNKNYVSIPSYQCKIGDIITVKNSKVSRDLVVNFLESPTLSKIPNHLDFDKQNLTAKVLDIIDRNCVMLELKELLVIEFYSRKI
jgi:small subunit ribosomal protein S4